MSNPNDPTQFISPDDLEGAGRRGLGAGQKVFERYRLEVIAGRGGMGVVWRARDEELDRTVALKFLPEAVAADVEAVRDLKNETKRCLELTHPQIVRVYDFVQGTAGTAIAMEFVEGESLASRKAAAPHGCLSVEEVARITGPLCAALDYAHFKAHLLHRDLKPANLLLTKEGDLKVMDFGIACSLAETRTRLTAKADHSTSGTLLYMSPQQLMGEKPSVADDIYSLGATLYELLTSKPPFYRGDGYSLMMQVREKLPVLMAQHRADLQITGDPIPEIWEKVVSACLAKDPADRPQSAGEVAERLGLAMPTLGTTSGKSTGRSKAAREAAKTSAAAKKSRVGLIAAAAAAVLAIGLGVYFFGRNHTATPAPGSTGGAPETAALSGAAAANLPGPGGSAPAGTSSPAAATPSRMAPPADARGGIIVRTDPEGAEVSVGALDHGVGPMTLREVKLGHYPVRVRAPGYEEWTGAVDVKENDFVEVKAALVRSTGTLVLTSEPAGLAVEVTGKAVPGGPPPTARRQVTTPEKLVLPAGSYEVVFRRPGWPDQLHPAEVRRNQLVESAAAFVTGNLVITSEPAGARVVSAGKTLGVTPLTLPDLPPGPQAVELRLAGYAPAKLNGVVAARQDLKLSAILERARLPEPGQPLTLSDPELTMQYIVPGSFVMGSPESEAHRESNEGPQTQVTLTQGFWLGKTEVTQSQYLAVMGTNPSKFAEAGKDAPVENVSWTDAMEFCRRLTERERSESRLPEGYAYTLPTEAQWEYACRAATTTPYAGPLGEMAWFDKAGGKTTRPVGQKTANAWGLFDMYGNVEEWCLDLYADRLPGGSVTDYAGPATGSRQVYRGGDWDSSEKECRSASRTRESADERKSTIGFRLALSRPQSTGGEAGGEKPTRSGFFSGVKSAYGSVVKVFKPGEKQAGMDPSASSLNVTVNKAPPAPFRFTLVLQRADSAAGPLEFPVDEMVTKGRADNGSFTATLSVPPGTYRFVLKSPGFKDVSEVGPRFVIGRKKDEVALKAGSEQSLEFELEPAKAE